MLLQHGNKTLRVQKNTHSMERLKHSKKLLYINKIDSIQLHMCRGFFSHWIWANEVKINIKTKKQIQPWHHAMGVAVAQWQCPPLNWKVGCSSMTTEWIAVVLLGQERSPQPPQQEANFRLQPVANDLKWCDLKRCIAVTCTLCLWCHTANCFWSLSLHD